jgi:chromate transport protein ChrA
MDNQKRMVIIETIGWYGPVALILAYALVNFDAIKADSYVFQLLNLTGAIAIIVISAAKRVYQSVVLNIFWSIIAIVALVRLVIA